MHPRSTCKQNRGGVILQLASLCAQSRSKTAPPARATQEPAGGAAAPKQLCVCVLSAPPSFQKMRKGKEATPRHAPSTAAKGMCAAADAADAHVSVCAARRAQVGSGSRVLMYKPACAHRERERESGTRPPRAASALPTDGIAARSAPRPRPPPLQNTQQTRSAWQPTRPQHAPPPRAPSTLSRRRGAPGRHTPGCVGRAPPAPGRARAHKTPPAAAITEAHRSLHTTRAALDGPHARSSSHAKHPRQKECACSAPCCSSIPAAVQQQNQPRARAPRRVDETVGHQQLGSHQSAVR